MKYLPLFSSLLAIAAASPLAEVAEEAAPQDVEAVSDSPADWTANGVKILPRFAATKPKDGATRTVVKYGTYSVNDKMLSKVKLVKGPCPAGNCFITAMEATIRYPDGKEANVDTGAWLHHIALFGTGAGGGSIWACGNERPTLRLNTEEKYGLALTQFMLMIDLMTETAEKKTLTLEIAYETVPKTTAGYKAAVMYWLTIGEPAAKDGIYKFTSQSQNAGYSGKLLYAIGHMHDGGKDMRLFVNGKLACKSVMHYNARVGYGKITGKAPAHAAAAEEEEEEEAPAAPKKTTKKTTKAAKKPAKAAASSMEGMEGMKMKRDGPPKHDGMEHISDPGACTDFMDVKKGDKLSSEAWYDAIAHPLMVHDGKKENLMGNMRVYMGPK